MRLPWYDWLILLCVVGMAAFNIAHTRKHGYADDEDRWATYADILLIVGLAVGTAASAFAFVPRVRWLTNFLTSPVGFVVSGVAVGLFLFVVRNRRKDVYGILEIGVAMIALVGAGQKFDPAQYVATEVAFMGGVYIFIRGLTNYTEGRAVRRSTRSRLP